MFSRIGSCIPSSGRRPSNRQGYNSNFATDIYQIDGIMSNRIEKNVQVSHLTAIPDDEQKDFDHKPFSTDGIMISPNVIEMFQKILSAML